MHLDQLIRTYGYAAIFVVIALENLGLPLSGEAILVTAAIYAGESQSLSIVAIISTAAVAALFGGIVCFFVGEYGERHWLHRYGRCVRLEERSLRLGRYLVRRYGGRMIFFARFVMFQPVPAGLLAGLNAMDRRRFVVFSGLGAMAWAGVYGAAAYLLGREFERLSATVGLMLGVLAIVVAGTMLWLLHRHRERFQQEADRAAAVEGSD